MNTEQVRNDFPLLAANPHLAYLDNGATTQKPAAVIRAVEDFYEKANANPLRGLYDLSQQATDRYEEAREAVRGFINAAAAKEIIFTRNATESLNLLAYSLGEDLREGDEIALTVMEHHSNLIPGSSWRKERGCASTGSAAAGAASSRRRPCGQRSRTGRRSSR